MKLKPILLCLIATLSLGTAFAETPIYHDTFYTFWYELPKDPPVPGLPGKPAEQSWVRVEQVNGDWAKVTLYGSEPAAVSYFMLDQIEKGTPIGKAFIASQKTSKEEFLKTTREELKKLPQPRVMWVNLTQVRAISEMEIKAPEAKKEK